MSETPPLGQAARRIGRRLRGYQKRLRERLVGPVRRRRFENNLRLLNDTLAATGLKGRYWIRAGLLLGWAREAAILRHDYEDADFGFFSFDRDRFMAAIPYLEAAGFRGEYWFRRNDGRATVFIFFKDGAEFDFIESSPCEEGLEYFLYYWGLKPPQQFRCVVPMHDLATIHFIGRDWCRPDPYEPYLETLYGNWRIPDPRFKFRDLGSVVDQVEWTGSHAWAMDRTVPAG